MPRVLIGNSAGHAVEVPCRPAGPSRLHIPYPQQVSPVGSLASLSKQVVEALDRELALYAQQIQSLYCPLPIHPECY